MATARTLVDTSLIIEFFRSKKKEQTLLHELLNNESSLCISVVTEFELLCGAKSEALLNDTMKLLRLFDIVDFNEAVAKTAAIIFQELKSKNVMIGLADIFIAATALVHDLPLATLNLSHFERISSVRLVLK